MRKIQRNFLRVAQTTLVVSDVTANNEDPFVEGLKSPEYELKSASIKVEDLKKLKWKDKNSTPGEITF